jgi:C1A family cysteine protease
MGLLQKLFSKKKERAEFNYLKTGLKKGKTDSRDYKFKRKTSIQLLPSVFIISKLPPIRNQLNIASCASHSAIAQMEIQLLNLKPNRYLEGSELYHYYNVRHYINGDNDKDEGQTIRDACKALSKYNMATEYTCPYITQKLNEKPSWVSYATSGLYKIKSYEQLNTIEEIKEAVYQCLPVNFGMNIKQSFLTLKDRYNPSGSDLGGHSTLIVGWDENRQCFYVRNSWGEKWGLGGYYWLPYSVFNSEAWDKWIVRLK